MLKKGLLARLVAKEGKEDKLEKFLTEAVKMAKEEEKTINWYAFKIDKSTFGIFDTFEGTAGQDAHLNGDIAAALMKQAPDLLSKDPVIEKIDFLAVK